MNETQLCYYDIYNIKCHYVDKVTKDTPILLKENENIKFLRIDEIVDEEDWYVDNLIVTSWEYKKIANCINFQILISNGWQKIKKLVTHKTKKTSYRIRTKHRIVEVTEDHSLIVMDTEIIKHVNW